MTVRGIEGGAFSIHQIYKSKNESDIKPSKLSGSQIMAVVEKCSAKEAFIQKSSRASDFLHRTVKVFFCFLNQIQQSKPIFETILEKRESEK